MRQLLFAGSYAAADAPGIYAFAIDPAGSAPSLLDAYQGVANPTFLALHPSGRYLYAASEISADADPSGNIWAFALQHDPLQLVPLGSQPGGGDFPCHLLVAPDGRWLFAANYGSGSLAALPIGPDGALGPPAAVVQHTGSGPHPERQEAPHAHASLLDPTGRHLIAADLGSDRLFVYRFNAAFGALEPHRQVATRPGAGPRHLVFHPAGRLLYVANELDNTVDVYNYDQDRAELSVIQTLETLPQDAGASQVAAIQIAPAGDRLYVSNRGHNSIAVFAVSADGRLERLATPACGGDWPRSFALLPEANLMLVANQRSGELVTLPLRPGAGELGAPAAAAPVPAIAHIIALPR